VLSAELDRQAVDDYFRDHVPFVWASSLGDVITVTDDPALAARLLAVRRNGVDAASHGPDSRTPAASRSMVRSRPATHGGTPTMAEGPMTRPGDIPLEFGSRAHVDGAAALLDSR
jgi:hypothetical protein